MFTAEDGSLPFSSQTPKSKFWLTYTIVPLTLLVLAFVLSLIRGPFYGACCFDPDYVYLLNATTLLDGGIPYHRDHPGTTMQIFGAVIVGIRHFLFAEGENGTALKMDVVRNPEDYLHWIHVGLLTLIAFATLFAGVIAGRKNRWLGVFLQAQVFLFPTVLLSVIRVNAEPLILFLSLLLITLLHLELHQTRFKYLSACIGAVIGFGIATKFTFLPLILSILMIQAWRQRLMALGFVALGFFLATNPINVHYPTIFGWIFAALTHSGNYGTGEIGLPAFGVLARNWKFLFLEEPMFFLFSVILFCSGLWGLIRKVAPRQTMLCLFIVGVVALLHSSIVTKHPEPRYILPSMVLCGWGVLILVEQLYSRNVRWQTIAIGVLIVSFAIATAALAKWMDAANRYAGDVVLIRNEAQESGCRLIPYYRSSMPLYALLFGNEWSDRFFASELNQLYPGAYHFNSASGSFYQASGPVPDSTIRKLLESEKCVLLTGTGTMKFTRYPNLQVTPVIIRSEALYRLTDVRQRPRKIRGTRIRK